MFNVTYTPPDDYSLFLDDIDSGYWIDVEIDSPPSDGVKFVLRNYMGHALGLTSEIAVLLCGMESHKVKDGTRKSINDLIAKKSGGEV